MKNLVLAGLMTLALAVPALAQAKKEAPKKGTSVEEIDAEKLKPGELAGKVMTASSTSLQVRVDLVHIELNQAKAGKAINYGNDPVIKELVRDQEYLAKLQQKVRTARNPRQQHQAIEHLQRETQRLQQRLQQKAVQQQLQAVAGKNGGQNLFKEIHDYKDVNVELDAAVKVRTAFLPSAFDDTGNIKKWTEAEKKEMKGEGADAKLVGYKASTSDLKPGQMVAVALAKSKDKEAENKMRGSLVLITKEADETVSKGEPKKKPKK